MKLLRFDEVVAVEPEMYVKAVGREEACEGQVVAVGPQLFVIRVFELGHSTERLYAVTRTVVEAGDDTRIRVFDAMTL